MISEVSLSINTKSGTLFQSHSEEMKPGQTTGLKDLIHITVQENSAVGTRSSFINSMK